MDGMLVGDDSKDRSMQPILDYPPVTAEILEEVVRRILTVGSPLRIVLFGSRATGRPRPWSDLKQAQP